MLLPNVVLLCLGLWMHCSSAAMIVVPSRLVKCLPVIEETARLKRIIEMVRSTHQIESGVDQIDIDRADVSGLSAVPSTIQQVQPTEETWRRPL